MTAKKTPSRYATVKCHPSMWKGYTLKEQKIWDWMNKVVMDELKTAEKNNYLPSTVAHNAACLAIDAVRGYLASAPVLQEVKPKKR